MIGVSAASLIFTILGIDKASGPLDKVAASADRTGSSLDRLGVIGLKTLPALTGAAVGSAVAVGGALAGATVLMGGLGIAAAASSTVVQDEYSSMAKSVVADMQDMAGPMVPALTAIAEKTTATFRQLRPQLAEAIEDSAEHVETLADGVLGFAKTAVPGMVTAVQRAGPTMDGFKRLMISTGMGVGEFFTELSEGSDEAGQSLTNLGVMIHQILGFAGRWFATLTTEGAPAVESLSMVMGKLLGVVEGLSSGGFPVLFSTAGMALQVLDGLLTVVAPLSTQLGTVAGAVLSVAAALRLMRAVGNFGGGLAAQFSTVSKAAEAADGRTNVWSSRLRNAVGLLGGPWGIALAGAGAMLMAFGSRQQESERHVRSFTDALKESKGAMDENVRASVAQALADKGAFEHARQLGITQSQLTDAVMGNVNAQRSLSTELDRVAAAGTNVVTTEHGVVEMTTASADSAYVLKRVLGETGGEFGVAVQKAKDYTAAMGDSTAQTNAATTASQRRKQALAAEQQQVWAAVDAEYALAGALRGIESAKFAATDATEDYNTAVKEHGVRSREAQEADLRRKDALDQLDISVRQAITAAGDHAAEVSGVTDEAERQRIATDAMNRKAIEMAATWKGPANDALKLTIGSMNLTTLSAMGVTREVKKTGEAVYTLPNGKKITLSAKDQATPAIRGVQNALNDVTKTPYIVSLSLRLANDPRRLIQSANLSTARARGGPVKAMQMYKVGEEGEELFVPGKDGYIVPADQTRRLLANAPDGQRPTVTVPAGQSGGVRVENVHVHAVGRPFTLDEVQRDLSWRGAI